MIETAGSVDDAGLIPSIYLGNFYIASIKQAFLYVCVHHLIVYVTVLIIFLWYLKGLVLFLKLNTLVIKYCGGPQNRHE